MGPQHGDEAEAERETPFHQGRSASSGARATEQRAHPTTCAPLFLHSARSSERWTRCCGCPPVGEEHTGAITDGDEEAAAAVVLPDFASLLVRRFWTTAMGFGRARDEVALREENGERRRGRGRALGGRQEGAKRTRGDHGRRNELLDPFENKAGRVPKISRAASRRRQPNVT